MWIPEDDLFISFFNEVLDYFKDKNIEVLDYLPDTNIGYPFIYIGETQEIDQFNKGGILGDVVQTIHIFNYKNKRGDVANITKHILRIAQRFDKGKFYFFGLKDTNINTLEENTADRPLIHKVIDCIFSYY